MKLRLKKNITYTKSLLDPNIFVPLFFIFTIIAFVNSLQAYYIYFKGVHSVINFTRFLISKLVYSWYFLGLAFVVLHLSKKIFLTKQTAVKWLLVHLAALSLSLILHQGLSLITDKLILRVESKETFISLLFKNPTAWLDVLVYGLFLLGFYLIEYKRINQENEIKCSQLEVELIKSKLQELRSKIHPQFLFNTLHTISGMVHKGRNKDANQVLELLSNFLRTTVYDNEREVITLEEELKFLHQYLNIEKVRLKNKLSVREEIELPVLNALVPNFILQPIVEEFVYPVMEKNNYTYEIAISAKSKDNMLEINIADNLSGLIDYSSGVKIDLMIFNITKERLNQLYGVNQSLESKHNTDGGGISVSLKIPFTKKNDMPEPAFEMENIF